VTAARVTILKEIANQVAQLLRANRGLNFCCRCLSVTLTLGDDVVVAATARLARGGEFRHDYWVCFRCRRTGSVIGAL